MCRSFSGFWSHDPNVLLVAGGGRRVRGRGAGGGADQPVFFFFVVVVLFLRFAVVGLCVDAVVTVHFDFNRIRLERLFSIFLLQR